MSEEDAKQFIIRVLQGSFFGLDKETRDNLRPEHLTSDIEGIYIHFATSFEKRRVNITDLSPAFQTILWNVGFDADLIEVQSEDGSQTIGLLLTPNTNVCNTLDLINVFTDLEQKRRANPGRPFLP